MTQSNEIDKSTGGISRPDLSDFDLSEASEPKDGILYLYRSSVDGFWHLTTDEDMALQEASGYPVGEIQKKEQMGADEFGEFGELHAVYISAGKWRDNRAMHTGTDGGQGDE